MTDLRDNQAESSAGFSAPSKLVSLRSSLIWGPSNIPDLSFLHVFFVEISNGKKQILYLPYPMPLQSSSCDRI